MTERANRDIREALDQKLGDSSPRIGGWMPKKSERPAGCLPILILLGSLILVVGVMAW